MNSKLDILRGNVEKLESAFVAYSGGVDSTFLLKVSHDILGDKAVAITIDSGLLPRQELEEANKFCKEEGIRHIVLMLDAVSIPGIVQNPVDRCYFCKKCIYKTIIKESKTHGIRNIIEGSNIDDLEDYRPGNRAVKELGIISPLVDAGFSKAEIRSFSRKLGLSVSEKESSACLASRIPYGEEITMDKLEKIEKAEDFLKNFGFRNLRVRLHGDDLARIEVMEADFDKVLKMRREIISKLNKLGFKYVTLDVAGYRMGSMNEAINK